MAPTQAVTLGTPDVEGVAMAKAWPAFGVAEPLLCALEPPCLCAGGPALAAEVLFALDGPLTALEPAFFDGTLAA